MNAAGANHIPMWLLAELTYACPLQCPYCSNPLQLPASRKKELSTEQWLSTMKQARSLGAVQLGFSGGEPLVRPDFQELLEAAVEMGFYCNLITSAVGLTDEKVQAFKQAGLSHIQISFQGSDETTNNTFGASNSFHHKMDMTRSVIRHGIPLGLNFVLHRQNMHQVTPFLELALSLGAEFVELANTQYYAWALHNRDQLMPSREQLAEAEAATNRFKEKHGDKMRVFFVAPDYFHDRPKKCSNGWGSTFLTVTPEGEVLPCQSAKVLPGLTFPNVKDQDLKSIWRESELFNRFRGTDWMQEPCASCPEKEEDLGGCRCQAYLLTGDPYATDPVCSLSPKRHLVDEAIAAADQDLQQNQPDEARPLLFRNPRNAKQFQ